MADDQDVRGNPSDDFDHSKLSDIALIEKFFSEVRNSDSGSRRSEKHEKNSTKFGNRFDEKEESVGGRNNRDDTKSSQKHRKSKNMATLESDKTSSSCTASDFASNVYSKNGYIRAGNDRKNDRGSNPLLKYNEFSSLITTLGKGSHHLPVEVKLDEKDGGIDEEKGNWLDEESSIFIILGGIQMMLGILMAVFGVLVIAHESSLSNAGSGLWGGAVAMFSGLMGILAGLKGCYAADKGMAKSSRTLLTIFLALCLISFALSNLVVVLTATGLIRDVQRSKESEEVEEDVKNFVDWPPILADVGLILSSTLQCVAAVFSGYKCYRKVCPCMGTGESRLSDVDSENERYKRDSKEHFVYNWLGQQFRMPEKKSKYEGQDSFMPWGTPNLVLLPPPPPIIANGQIPILTFLQSPSTVFASSVSGQMYPGSMGCCCRHEPRCGSTPQAVVHPGRMSRKANYLEPDEKVRSKSRNRCRAKKERRASLPTAEEVAKTYTGLDREMAEEFIAIAMDKGPKRSRNNSFSEYGIDPKRQGY